MTEARVQSRRAVFTGSTGLQLVADVRGGSDASPVLLLHGGGQTRHAWGNTAEILASKGWQTIAVDLRGHGESDWAPDGDYSLEAYGADCKALIAQLEEPPVLVGASLGGISAMIAEGTSKQEVSRCLVLVDIAPRTNSAGIERVRAFMRSGVGGFESIEDAAIAIAEYTPQRVRPINPIGMKKVLRERGGRLFWHWDPKFIEIERPQGSLELVMNNISVPVLLVRGELSDVVTEEYANELLFRMPNVAVVVVAGAAHMIAGDRNDGFSNSVVKFLDENILRE